MVLCCFPYAGSESPDTIIHKSKVYCTEMTFLNFPPSTVQPDVRVCCTPEKCTERKEIQPQPTQQCCLLIQIFIKGERKKQRVFYI